MRRTRHLPLAVGLLALGVALTGCSVIKGLAVEGNMNVIYLSSASTDVLLEQGYTIGSKPVCKLDDKEQQSYSCVGSTSANAPIKVTVSDGTVADPIMVITVGNKQIFSGSATNVINSNAEVTK